MAERRMFAKTIIDSDTFLDLPFTSQALYFHLGMRADDDGIINNPKSLLRYIGAKEDDLKILLAKKFIIELPNQLIVIKHWNINNYIRNDRYKKSKYAELLNLLEIDENGSYRLPQDYIENDEWIPNGYQMDTKWIPNGYQMDTKVSIGKNSIGKKEEINISNDIYKEEKNTLTTPSTLKKAVERHKYGEYKRILLSDEQYNNLINEFGETYIEKVILVLDEYIEMNNNKNKWTDFNLVIRKAIREKWKILDSITSIENTSNVHEEKSKFDEKALNDFLESM